jgi:putative DNA primase/helicase
MKKDTPRNGGRVETIGDEATYLRINQLKKGLLQFTDSTNAERLAKEHGADIRYIAPWKKWVVWDDTHWQVDTGALLYTKQLEMVRNIYAELYKTADYRERWEIEKYAVQNESMRRREASVRAVQYIPCLNATVGDLDTNPWLLNVENGMVDLKTGELMAHRKEDMITKLAKVRYDKEASCPM